MTTVSRVRNRDAADSSVAKLVKNFESLAAAARSSCDKTKKEGKEAGGRGRGAPVRRPQPRDHKDDCTVSVHVYGTRLKPSEKMGSGDGDQYIQRHNFPQKCFPTVRVSDRRVIEYASPETCPFDHHHRHSLNDNVTTLATKTITLDDLDTIEIVDVIINTGSKKMKTSAVTSAVTSVDVESNGKTVQFHIVCKSGLD